MYGMACNFNTFLLACILDKLSLLVWLQTDDGAKGKNRPKMIAGLLSGEKEKPADVISYASGKDFDEAREKILRQINGD